MSGGARLSALAPVAGKHWRKLYARALRRAKVKFSTRTAIANRRQQQQATIGLCPHPLRAQRYKLKGAGAKARAQCGEGDLAVTI
jgi:hypothetical protein